MDKSYTVSEQYVEKLFSKCSRTLVGEVMKRFELIEDKETLKKEIRELIYENYRSLKNLLWAFSTGVKFQKPTRRQD